MPENIHIDYGEGESVTGAFKDLHEVEAMVFTCLDPRFLGQVTAYFFTKLKMAIDLFSFPGIMLLVGHRHGHPDMLEGTLYWMKQMKAAHHAKKFIFLFHGNVCGAYKLAPKFQEMAAAGVGTEELAESIRKAQEADAYYIQELMERNFPGVPAGFLYVEPATEGDSMNFFPMSVGTMEESLV